MEIRRKELMITNGVDVDMAERQAVVARERAVAAADSAMSSAKKVFDSVVNNAKVKLSTLKDRQARLNQEYKIKV